MVVIKDLFIENRFPNGWKLIPLLVYLPVGIVLATMRLFIGVQAICAASLLQQMTYVRAVILRTMCAIMGLVVQQENTKARDDTVKVIVSNHISVFDHLAIHLITGSISINVAELPAFFHYAFSYRTLGSLRDKKTLAKNLRGFMNKENVPVDMQPEEAITSGRRGLLRFTAWPCSLSQPVQPVVLRIWRPPLMEVSPSVISATWFSDFFWFLFVPFTVFTIKYLPIMEQLENESEEEMARRVETAIAAELQIETTSLTSTDKVEYEKRVAAENAEKRSRITRTAHRPTGRNTDPAIMEMATRVKEVLPNVPIKIICSELAKTRNVDTTIANFLEGLIRYTPESSPPAASNVTVSSSPVSKTCLESTMEPSSSQVCFDTSAKTFPKNAHERMLSFQERKQRLIESARRRYMEKHALSSALNNS